MRDSIIPTDFLDINASLITQLQGIKYVCMQGSPVRARILAKKLATIFLKIDESYFEPVDLSKNSLYQIYRIGNVLSVSHGMGCASIMTLLHNLRKILDAAGNLEVEYIRIGTCGGIGLMPGSVVLTNVAYTSELIAGYKVIILGQDVVYPTHMDDKLNQKILAAQPQDSKVSISVGNTVAADDFYLGQARFDGAIAPRYTPAMRQEYFSRMQALNILNIEMESTALASFANRFGIQAAMVAVTMLDRLVGDQVVADEAILASYANNAQIVVINYLQQNQYNSMMFR